eukprot:11170118-Lingulodinium_polyedra.AAC.1
MDPRQEVRREGAGVAGREDQKVPLSLEAVALQAPRRPWRDPTGPGPRLPAKVARGRAAVLAPTAA